jgi:hypothetical protein
MISFVRTGAIAPGKGTQALALAQKIVAYWQSNYDQHIYLLRPIGGNPLRLAFTSSYTDLTEFEKMLNKTSADQKYMELLASGADCWIPGSLNDEIWRSA